MSDYSKYHWMKDLPNEPMENFHCQPDKPLKNNLFNPKDGCVKGKEIWDASLPQTYQPETIAIPILEVENIIDALEVGLEHTQAVLSEHDVSLGRTTLKNERWAETLEKDVEFFKTRIKLLKTKLTSANTHYP